MNRRVALKHVMMAMAAASVLPACSAGSKKTSVPLKHLKIDGDQEELLAQITEALIPATDVPGARALGVHLFVLTMIDDCYDASAQENFVAGLKGVEAGATRQFNKLFSECGPKEREDILRLIDKKDASYPKEMNEFFARLKQLTIQGFLTSQYVMTQQGYEFVPGRFNGCVDVPKSKSA